MTSKRIIKKNRELKKAAEYFNFFHDGFLKSIKLVSANKFEQGPPWEKPRQYESSEEELLATGLSFSDKLGLFVEIRHYNYDWPNKARGNQIVLYLQNVRAVDPNIVQMVGMPIYHCEVVTTESGLAMTFTFETYVNNKTGRTELETLEFEKTAIWEKS